MKKLFILLLVGTALLIKSSLFAEELIFSGKSIKSQYYNEIGKGFMNRPMNIYYSAEDKTVRIVVKDMFYEYRVPLDAEQMSEVSKMLNKYTKWEKTAVAKKVTLEKIIGTININLYWLFSNEWHAGPSTLTVSFLSQTAKRHQLVITFGQTQSSSNEFMKYKPEPLYLEKAEVIKLKKQLTLEHAKKSLSQYNKQKDKENKLFK